MSVCMYLSIYLSMSIEIYLSILYIAFKIYIEF